MTLLPELPDYEILARELAARDPRMARCLEAGTPLLLNRPPGFHSLLRIILGQQVSTAAAASIWNKTFSAVAPLTPETFLSLDDDALRTCGFSRQKIAYARGLASAIVQGTLDLDALPDLDDAAVTEALVGLKGFGNWSAEMYLIFSLNRLDVWPVDDLAIALGVQRLIGAPERLHRKELVAIGEAWRPYRSVAARMIWTFY